MDSAILPTEVKNGSFKEPVAIKGEIESKEDLQEILTTTPVRSKSITGDHASEGRQSSLKHLLFQYTAEDTTDINSINKMSTSIASNSSPSAFTSNYPSSAFSLYSDNHPHNSSGDDIPSASGFSRTTRALSGDTSFSLCICIYVYIYVCIFILLLSHFRYLYSLSLSLLIPTNTHTQIHLLIYFSLITLSHAANTLPPSDKLYTTSGSPLLYASNPPGGNIFSVNNTFYILLKYLFR